MFDRADERFRSVPPALLVGASSHAVVDSARALAATEASAPPHRRRTLAALGCNGGVRGACRGARRRGRAAASDISSLR